MKRSSYWIIQLKRAGAAAAAGVVLLLVVLLLLFSKEVAQGVAHGLTVCLEVVILYRPVRSHYAHQALQLDVQAGGRDGVKALWSKKTSRGHRAFEHGRRVSRRGQVDL